MRRRQQFVSPERNGSAAKVPDTDWEKKVFICREDSTSNIRCPLNSKSGDPQECYSSLRERIHMYKRLKQLLLQMNVERSSAGVELEKSLFQYSAKHHKNCYEIFPKAKLERMDKNRAEQKARPTTRSSGKQILTVAILGSSGFCLCYFTHIKSNFYY